MEVRILARMDWLPAIELPLIRTGFIGGSRVLVYSTLAISSRNFFSRVNDFQGE